MNPPHDPLDPLLQILVDEASDLPARAAREARQRSASHLQRRLPLALAVFALLLGASIWPVIGRREAKPGVAAVHSRPAEPAAPMDSPAPTEPGAREFVKVQTVEEITRDPLPLPEGLDQEQQALFKAARGLPLLLVRDSSGKVTRIHVIER